jgi:glutathione S-transferase
MTTEQLVLYSNPKTRGRIARWMLEETGMPYRAEMIDFDRMKSPGYLAINPMGKVPALAHGATIVTECAAICAYLADAFPDARLAPPSGKRGDYYRWLFFAAGPLEAAVSNKAFGLIVPPDKTGASGYGTYEQTIDTLEQAVRAHPYIAGEAFTAADVYVGSHLMWGMQFGTIEKREAFQDYCARVEKRPAHLRATALDDAAMSQQA